MRGDADANLEVLLVESTTTWGEDYCCCDCSQAFLFCATFLLVDRLLRSVLSEYSENKRITQVLALPCDSKIENLVDHTAGRPSAADMGHFSLLRVPNL